MSLFFEGSKKSTLGLEIELQILDAHSLDLSPQSKKILSICKQQGLERVHSEMHQSMIEINSEICENVKQCKADLQDKISKLNRIVESQELKLAVTGTHPFQNWHERLISCDERYQNLHGKYQWLIRRMNTYAIHVHIGVPSKERVLALCYEIIPYFPIE
ncbi:MAG TPA: glutamate-cysteine ligase family protein [Rhabdochlamydiaceae bacterium]|jgi:carboxylate-amine ligase